jgi:hypothetical protein
MGEDDQFVGLKEMLYRLTRAGSSIAVLGDFKGLSILNKVLQLL